MLNRRSKSFNDLSNISLDGEVNLDLELGLALQDQGSRYSGLTGPIYGEKYYDRNMNFQTSLETSLERSSDRGLADIESSGELHFDDMFRMPTRRKLSSAWIHKLLEVGKNMLHEPGFKKKYKEDVMFKNF